MTPYTGLANQRIRPLCHLSGTELLYLLLRKSSTLWVSYFLSAFFTHSFNLSQKPNTKFCARLQLSKLFHTPQKCCPSCKHRQSKLFSCPQLHHWTQKPR